MRDLLQLLISGFGDSETLDLSDGCGLDYSKDDPVDKSLELKDDINIKCFVCISENLVALARVGENSIILWNIDEKKIVKTLNGHTSSVNVLTKMEGNLLASGSDDRTIIIWDLGDGYKQKKTFKGHTGAIKSICQISSHIFASGAAWPDRTIRIWDMSDDSKNPTMITSGNWVSGNDGLFVSHDRKRLFCSNLNLEIIDLEKN